MSTTGKPRGNIKGVALGKTRYIRRKNKDGYRRMRTTKKKLAEKDFIKRLDDAWRGFFMKRFGTIPQLPCTYVIPCSTPASDLKALASL